MLYRFSLAPRNSCSVPNRLMCVADNIYYKLIAYCFTKYFQFQLDATAFGHLCQVWYMPYESNIKKYMKEKCQSLVDFLERMKTSYWADWDEICVPPPPTAAEVTQNAEQVAEEKADASKPE